MAVLYNNCSANELVDIRMSISFLEEFHTMAPNFVSTGVALLLFLVSCSRGQDLASYEKSKVLVSGQYELYWTYKPDSSALEMAVRVKTLGWFGLGVSADGQMSNSDVVIGWVTAEGTAMLRVSTLHNAYCCVASYNSYVRVRELSLRPE